MDSFIRQVNALSEWSGKIVSYLVYGGIAVLAIEVCLRYFFNAPTVWAHGYSQRLFGTYFVLVGAYTLQKGGHVRVDVLYVHLRAKGQAILDLMNYGLLLVWSIVLITEGWAFFWNSFSVREVDEMVLAHPVYPYKFFIVVGALFIALQGIAQFLVTLRTLLRGGKV
jgi:TRAP-type mannitol/chloroaromatic compound transport system permease small subunit